MLCWCYPRCNTKISSIGPGSGYALLLPRRFSTNASTSTSKSTSSQANLQEAPLVIHIPKASVYCFGDGKHAQPLFRDVAWTVKEGESWAVIGSGGGGEKTIVFEVCMIFHFYSSILIPISNTSLFPLHRPSSAAIEYHRILLPQAVSFPFLISPASTHTQKSLLSPSDTGNKPEANFTTTQRGTAPYKKKTDLRSDKPCSQKPYRLFECLTKTLPKRRTQSLSSKHYPQRKKRSSKNW
jgi:hypothetical protein